jgi:hypothetical protein
MKYKPLKKSKNFTDKVQVNATIGQNEDQPHKHINTEANYIVEKDTFCIKIHNVI